MRRYQPVLHGLLTGLLQLTEVADYWPSSFFLLKIERNGGLKKDQGQHPAMLTEQAWSMNNLSCGFRRNFSCGTRWLVPIEREGLFTAYRKVSIEVHIKLAKMNEANI